MAITPDFHKLPLNHVLATLRNQAAANDALRARIAVLEKAANPILEQKVKDAEKLAKDFQRVAISRLEDRHKAEDLRKKALKELEEALKGWEETKSKLRSAEGRLAALAESYKELRGERANG